MRARCSVFVTMHFSKDSVIAGCHAGIPSVVLSVSRAANALWVAVYYSNAKSRNHQVNDRTVLQLLK